MSEQEKNDLEILAKKAGEPLYLVQPKLVGAYHMLVAREIAENGDLHFGMGSGFAGTYPITSLTPLGLQKVFYPFGGPARIIRFNVEELFPLIAGIEEELEHRYYIEDDGFFINAFELGSFTGKRKKEDAEDYSAEYFETPVSFFNIEVNRDRPISDLEGVLRLL